MDRQPLPREIQKWIHSLDLSYKIVSYKKDLSSGFIFGEILSKVDRNKYNVNMRMFNTGNSMVNKKSNWEVIRKITKLNKTLPFTDETIDKIINQAPNVSFETLIKLYKVATSKSEVYVIRRVDETDKFKQYDQNMPKAMRPTALKMLRNGEIQREPDNRIRKNLILQVLKQHRRYLDKERQEFKQNDFSLLASTKKFNAELKDSVMNLNNGDNSYNYNSRFSNNMRQSTDRDMNNLKTEKSTDMKFEKKDEKITLMSVINKEYNQVNLVNSNFNYSGYNNPDRDFNINLPETYNIKEIFWEPQVKSISSDYNVEVNFGKIIKKYFIESEHNIELEFKKYSDDREKDKNNDYIGFFFNRFSLCSEDKLKTIFKVFQEKEIFNDNLSSDNKTNESITKEESSEVLKFIEIISKTLLELQPFLKIITTFIEVLPKQNITDIVYPAIRICQGVLVKDPIRCEGIFLNYGLDILLKIMSEKPYFRNYMFQIIASLIINNKYSHYKVLLRIKEKFVHDEINYYHLLAKWMEFSNRNNMEDDDALVASFYYNVCKKGIKSNCDIIKAKTLYMLLIFMDLNEIALPLTFSDDIFRLKKTFNWEVLSLILIYCSLMLKILNIHKEKKKEIEIYGNNNRHLFDMEEILDENLENSNMNNSGSNRNNNLNKDNSLKDSISMNNINNNNNNKSLTGNTQEIKEMDISEISKNNKHNLSYESNNKNQDSKKSRTNKLILNKEDYDQIKLEVEHNEANMEELQKKEEEFLYVLDFIFQVSSPNLTIKIGFIYLSEIIHFYPQLAEKYMDILINFKYNKTRIEVLSVEQEGQAEEYTFHCYTEKYLICGAPKLWKPITTAQFFADYVKKNSLDRLERTLLDIFGSIIINQEFIDEEYEEWLRFFNDLKSYLFLAMCEKDFSEDAVKISKKFFDFEKIRNRLLDVS